jgi:hypothetical protein
MKKNTSQLATLLSDASVKHFYSPFEAIVFPEKVEMNSWFTSPELLSLYGQPEWEQLTEEQRRKLSFLEAVNFYSLNIHGEKALIEGLAQRLYDEKSAEHSRYIHHFLDEENKHMIFFGTFCMKYAGKVYPDRKLAFERTYEDGEKDFLFFLKVFLFEEIVDYHNLTMGKDERLEPLARKINQYHHFDEARHLTYGRAVLVELFQQHVETWGPEKMEEIRQYIGSYIQTTFREYYNPDVYQDLGLENPYDLADRVFHSEISRQHRKTVLKNVFKFLLQNQILLEEPAV